MRTFLDWEFYTAQSANSMGDVWHGDVKSLSVCFLCEYKPEMSTAASSLPLSLSQFIQSHRCQFCCHCQCSSSRRRHVSRSYFLTVSSATLHAKKSEMTCIAGSLRHFHLSLVISIGKAWGIVWDLLFFQVTNHVNAQFRAFQRLKDKSEELGSRNPESI